MEDRLVATETDADDRQSEDRAGREVASAAGQRGLRLRALTKHFGKIVAVDDVSLDVEHGTYVVLLGPSGCGKTTILRMIGGHEVPTSGQILLDGEELSRVPPARRPTTTVFQHFALFPHKSVVGNIEFGPRMSGIDKAERDQRVNEIIELLGLREMRNRKPAELSGGQQQRVALGRVLVTRPKLLLLDEPLGDLDRLLQLRMRVELRELQRELGITFIHVTHNQEEALSMADEMVVMEGGRIMQSGSPTEISQHPRNEFVAAFMGDNNILHGSVRQARDGQVLIDGDLGTYEAPNPAGRTLDQGQQVTIAVRANAVRVASGSSNGDVNSLAARIHITEYLGDIVKVHMNAGERSLLAKVPESRFGEVSGLHGEPVVASWRAEDVQILDD
jgi:ABC-type Fe3+/spermidine/putrescine transport system ATPase subunit